MDVTIKEKYLAICNTLMINTASVRFRPIFMEIIKQDAADKIKSRQEAEEVYNKLAKAYYDRYGTSGEY